METIQANQMPPPVVREQKLLLLSFTSDSRLGDRSNFEGIMYRAKVSGDPKVRCRVCRGLTWGNQRELDKWDCDKAAFDKAQVERRRQCEWTGEDPGPALHFENVRPQPMPQGECKRCGGKGEHPGKSGAEVTARPTGSSHRTTNVTMPSDRVILEAAAASRVMMRVERANHLHWGVLQAYHGALGEWAAGEHGNRLLAVMVLLPDCQRFIVDAMSQARAKADERATKRAASLPAPPSQADVLDLQRAEAMLEGRWSDAAAAHRQLDRLGRKRVEPDPEVSVSARAAIQELHTLSTRSDDKRARFEQLSVDAYQLLLDACRTWEGCLDA